MDWKPEEPVSLFNGGGALHQAGEASPNHFTPHRNSRAAKNKELMRKIKEKARTQLPQDNYPRAAEPRSNPHLTPPQGFGL